MNGPKRNWHQTTMWHRCDKLVLFSISPHPSPNHSAPESRSLERNVRLCPRHPQRSAPRGLAPSTRPGPSWFRERSFPVVVPSYLTPEGGGGQLAAAHSARITFHLAHRESSTYKCNQLGEQKEAGDYLWEANCSGKRLGV